MSLPAILGVASCTLHTKKGYIAPVSLMVLLLSGVTVLGRQVFLEARALQHSRRLAEAANNASSAAELSGYRGDGSLSLSSIARGGERHLLVFVLHSERGAGEARLYMDAGDWLRGKGVRPLGVCSGKTCAGQGGDTEAGFPVVAYASYAGMKAAADADAAGKILLVDARNWFVEKRLRRPGSMTELRAIIEKALAEKAAGAKVPAGGTANR
jgi:hypothetical protein